MRRLQKTIVCAIIKNDKGEILIDKRNQPDFPEAHGKWEFPGGRIEFGEEPETAIIREVKEETGLDVTISRLLPKIYSNTWKRSESELQVFVLTYECRVTGGQLGTTDEKISDLKFIIPSDIRNYDTLPGINEFVKEFCF